MTEITLFGSYTWPCLMRGARRIAALDCNTVYNFQTAKLVKSFTSDCLPVAKSHRAKSVENSLRSAIHTVRKKSYDFKILVQFG